MRTNPNTKFHTPLSLNFNVRKISKREKEIEKNDKETNKNPQQQQQNSHTVSERATHVRIFFQQSVCYYFFPLSLTHTRSLYETNV